MFKHWIWVGISQGHTYCMCSWTRAWKHSFSNFFFFNDKRLCSSKVCRDTEQETEKLSTWGYKMAMKKERKWYWRDSLGNAEQHLQSTAEVDYLKPEDSTPLWGVTTPAGTFRLPRKKKTNTKIEQEKHWFQPNGKKTPPLRLPFLRAHHSVEQIRCIQQDRIPSSSGGT